MDYQHLKSIYQRNGIIFPLQALNAFEINMVQQQYLKICEKNTMVLRGAQRIFGHLLYPWVAKLATHSAILDKVRCLIGSNILVLVSEFNSIAPSSNQYFSWHQDLYYWNYQYDHELVNIPIVTVWLALFSTDALKGCLRVIPKNHHYLKPHQENLHEYNLLTRGQELEAAVDENDAIDVELAAGEFSIHHPLIYHASGGNLSNNNRVGLVMRYLSPEITPPKRPAYAWLVSGEDEKKNWDHIAPLDMCDS